MTNEEREKLAMRVVKLEEKTDYIEHTLEDIKSDVKEIKRDIKELSNGGYRKILHDQNENLFDVILSLAKKRENADIQDGITQSQNSTLDRQIKLKIWHVIAIVASSGIISLILQFFIDRM